MGFIVDIDLDDPKIEGWDGAGGGPPAIPPGEYLFEVVSAKEKTTKAGDGKNIVIDYVVVDGDFKGKTIQQSYLAEGEKVKSGHLRRIKHVFGTVLSLTRLPDGGFEPEEAVGRRMYATASHETSAGAYDPVSGKTKEFVNLRLTCERAEHNEAEAAIAAPPVPTRAAPAAPARAATAPPARPPVAQPVPARPAARAR